MGINVSGIAGSIKKANVKLITESIGIIISDTYEELFFEYALSNSMEEDDLFFTETKNGFIITAGNKFDIFKIRFRNLSNNGHKLLKFVIGDTSTFYFFEYLENGNVLRRKLSIEYEVHTEKGKLLNQEFKGLSDDELVEELMIYVSGDSVYSIDEKIKTKKYKIITIDEIVTGNPPK